MDNVIKTNFSTLFVKHIAELSTVLTLKWKEQIFNTVHIKLNNFGIYHVFSYS